MRLIWPLIFIFSYAKAQTSAELARRIDILSEEIQNIKAYQLQMGDVTSRAYNLGPSASKVYFIPKGISIGAYGEVVYNHQAKENQAGDPVANDPTAEALRLVTYIGYKFNDKWIVNSEIEIEHVDEIYNEFMYVDNLASEAVNYRFGLILLPVGFINEQHEPILFPSVNRPEIENKIIPTTWRELGMGLFGTIGKFSYKAFLLNGGDADSLTPASGFRKIRKKGGVNNNASTGAGVVRLDYNYDRNHMFGFSLYSGQASSTGKENLQTQLTELHCENARGPWRLRALITRLQYLNATDWNETGTNTNLPSALTGGYIEALYRISQGFEVYEPFLRYERMNLNADFNTNQYSYNGALDFNTIRLGVAYKPLSQITFKADYAFIDEQGINEFNIGMGFNF